MFHSISLGVGHLGCTRSEDRLGIPNLKLIHYTVFTGTPLEESVMFQPYQWCVSPAELFKVDHAKACLYDTTCTDNVYVQRN